MQNLLRLNPALVLFIGLSAPVFGQTPETPPPAAPTTDPTQPAQGGKEGGPPIPTSGYLNYPEMSHQIEVLAVRAGNHDEKENEYYFTVQAFALVTQKVERKKELKDRKKIEESLGKFGELKLLPLSERDPKAGTLKFEISGETLRQLVSHTMRELNVREFEVSVMVEVKMFEKNKLLFFFGDDTLVGKAEYFIIEDTLPHQKLPGPKELVIEDTKGLKAVLKVSYAGAPATTPAP